MDVIYRRFNHTEFDIDSYEPYYEWDIALLYMDEAVPLGENVRPICLPEKGLEETTRGQFGMGFVTGWGMQWDRKSHKLVTVAVTDKFCRFTEIRIY